MSELLFPIDKAEAISVRPALTCNATKMCLLAFKLALAPLLILILFAGIFAAEGPVMRVTVSEAAMAPMIGASIVAMDHELDPPLVTLMIGVGIPLSFLTLPAWWYLLTLV
jgi:malate permease and related proteins